MAAHAGLFTMRWEHSLKRKASSSMTEGKEAKKSTYPANAVGPTGPDEADDVEGVADVSRDVTNSGEGTQSEKVTLPSGGKRRPKA